MLSDEASPAQPPHSALTLVNLSAPSSWHLGLGPSTSTKGLGNWPPVSPLLARAAVPVGLRRQEERWSQVWEQLGEDRCLEGSEGLGRAGQGFPPAAASWPPYLAPDQTDVNRRERKPPPTLSHRESELHLLPEGAFQASATGSHDEQGLVARTEAVGVRCPMFEPSPMNGVTSGKLPHPTTVNSFAQMRTQIATSEV